MTTATWGDSVLHSSDANFRIWGKAISDALQACGLVKTADTGQIDWATVSRPAIGASAGYEIYYLNDSLHATSPLYLKVEYGTGAATDYPALGVTIGQGSDGAGNLTGRTTTRRFGAPNNTSMNDAGSWPTYVCVCEGTVFVARRVGIYTNGLMQVANCGFAVSRTTDSNGDLNGIGAVVLFSPGNSLSPGYTGFGQAVRFAAPTELFNTAGGAGNATDAANFFNLPGTQTDTDVDGDTQATICVVPTPQFMAVRGLGCAMVTELAVGSTANIEFFPGAGERTYLQVGAALGCTGARKASADDALVGLLVVWE